VAADARGDAIFTWEWWDGENYRIQMRERFVGGRLGKIVTLSPAGQDAFYPKVAGDIGGDAAFVWEQSDPTAYRTIRARIRSYAGALSSIQTLSPRGYGGESPEVAVDHDGKAVFTWMRLPTPNLPIQTRVRFTDGGLGRIKTLASDGNLPQLAVDPSGDTVFTWSREINAASVVEAGARSSSGVLSPAEIIDADTRAQIGTFNTERPQVGMDADGNAVFTWLRYDHDSSIQDCCYRVLFRVRNAAGAMGAALPLSSFGQNASYPKVAVDAKGTAAFVWTRFDGTYQRIQARTRDAGGTIGDVRTLSEWGHDASEPDVAIDTAGRAVSTWVRFGGESNRIQMAVQPSG
jgi:hypothetical protein